MKKLLFLLLIVVITVSMIATFPLTGCKKEEAATTAAAETTVASETTAAAETTAASETTAAKGVTTIKFAAIFWTEPGRKELWEGFAKKFEEKFPQYKIEAVGIPWTEYGDKMKILLTSNPPDLMFDTGVTDLRVWEEQGYLEPLNDYFDWNTLINELAAPGLQKMVEYQGKMYGLIAEACNYGGIFYNKKLMEGVSVPKTPDELISLALKLTKAPDQYGYITPTTSSDGRLLFWVMYAIYGFGGKIIRDDGTFGINSPETIEGVKFYKKLIDSGAVPKGMDYTVQRKLFYGGKAAMAQEGGYFQTWALGANPELKGLLDVFYAPYPTKNNILEPTFFSISSKSSPEAKKGAVEFLKFYLTPAIQEEWINNCGYPVTMKNAATEEFKKQTPWYKVFEDTAPYGLPWTIPGYEVQTPEIQKILTDHIGRVMDLNEDPIKAMNDAQKEVEALVGK